MWACSATLSPGLSMSGVQPSLARRGRYQHTQLEGPGRRKLVGAEVSFVIVSGTKPVHILLTDVLIMSTIKYKNITEKSLSLGGWDIDL